MHVEAVLSTGHPKQSLGTLIIEGVTVTLWRGGQIRRRLEIPATDDPFDALSQAAALLLGEGAR